MKWRQFQTLLRLPAGSLYSYHPQSYNTNCAKDVRLDHPINLPFWDDSLSREFPVEARLSLCLDGCRKLGNLSDFKFEPLRATHLSKVGIAPGNYGRDGPQWLQKILIVNGHGGNASLLPYFGQSQLDKPHDYVVYIFDQRTPATGGPKRKTTTDQHAGESETSKMMVVRPDLLRQERAASESGTDQHRQNLPEGVYTGIWWYARFPDHYAGDGTAATHESFVYT